MLALRLLFDTEIQFENLHRKFRWLLMFYFILIAFNDFTYRWYVIWIISEIHVRNLSVKIWGYCILIGILANQTIVRMLWLVQSKECLPSDCSLTLRFNLKIFIENSDDFSCFTLYSLDASREALKNIKGRIEEF